MSHRIEKVNSLIQKYIAEILGKDLSLKKGIFLTVSKVDTSADLRYTHIFVSVYPASESDYALKTLNKEIFSIQGSLNKKLQMKVLPKIKFELDNRQENISELDKIFEEIRKEGE